jgi:hypothetical protein
VLRSLSSLAQTTMLHTATLHERALDHAGSVSLVAGTVSLVDASSVQLLPDSSFPSIAPVPP